MGQMASKQSDIIQITLQSAINNSEELKNFLINRFGTDFSVALINENVINDLYNQEQYSVVGVIAGASSGIWQNYSCYSRLTGSGPSTGFGYVGTWSSGYMAKLHAGDVLDIVLYNHE